MRTQRHLPILIATVGLGLTPAAALASQQQDAARTRAIQRVEREQARFRTWDANSDGIITQREWRGSALAFRQLDTDGNRELAGREIWIRLPTDTTAYTEEDQRREDLLDAFYRADSNQDGRLARTEWWNDRNLFSRIDANRDGVLTPGEFIYSEEAIDVPTGTTGDPRKETRAYQSGYQRGLAEGREAGKEDKTLRNQWDLEGQRELEQADSGYTNELGLREDYQAGYRAGFRQGYKQGFGPR